VVLFVVADEVADLEPGPRVASEGAGDALGEASGADDRDVPAVPAAAAELAEDEPEGERAGARRAWGAATARAPIWRRAGLSDPEEGASADGAARSGDQVVADDPEEEDDAGGGDDGGLEDLGLLGEEGAVALRGVEASACMTSEGERDGEEEEGSLT
jgi:hypothetical protein